MKTITTTKDLAAFCDHARGFDYVTVDTEFLRERTYYAKLCLIQLAVPGEGADDGRSRRPDRGRGDVARSAL